MMQCQGALLHSKSKASHVRRLYQNELKLNNSMSKNAEVLTDKVTAIKRDVENLREAVKCLPKIMGEEISNARLASERLISGTSNFTGTFLKIIFIPCHFIYLILYYFILFHFISFFSLDMQAKLLETELALDEALQRASAEKNRRRTLHNVLVVNNWKHVYL